MTEKPVDERDLSDPIVTPEDLRKAFDGNPFVLKPPTRKAFPGGILEALPYYETHLATCIAAEDLLSRAAGHCLKLAETSRECADTFGKLTAAQLEEIGVTRAHVDDYARVSELAAPHVITFASSAREYSARRELLERTIAALKAGL